MSLCPIVSTDSIRAGRAVSATISASTSAASGVFNAGLSSIGAPTAIAGATLCATRFSGKLNGVIASTGPRGKRRTTAIRPVWATSVSSRMRSPAKRRASSAAQRKVDTARATSDVAHIAGLPFSAVIRAAISSPRSASRALMWSSAAARTWAGRACASERTAVRSATACSAWAAVGRDTSATRLPSNGDRTSKLPSPKVGTPER